MSTYRQDQLLDNSASHMKREPLILLQALRAVAFLSIFLLHSQIQVGGDVIFTWGGTWGVSIFFVLSGFLMAYNYQGNNRIKENGLWYSLNFGIARIRKLYSLHILLLILMIAQYAVSSWHSMSVSQWISLGKQFCFDALLLQSWHPSPGIYFSLNGVAWYLSTSLFLYCCFPLIERRLLSQYRNRKMVLGSTVLIWAVQSLASYAAFAIVSFHGLGESWITWSVYIFPVMRLGDFLIGCNLGYLFLHRQPSRWSSNKGSLLLATVCVLTILQWSLFVYGCNTSQVQPWWSYAVLYAPTSCALIYLLAEKKSAYKRSAVNNFLVFLGNLSPYAFLIHQVVLKWTNGAIWSLISSYDLDVHGVAFIIAGIAFALTIVLSLLWKRLISRS